MKSDPLLDKLKTRLKNIQKDKGGQFYGWRLSINESTSLQSLLVGNEELGFEPYQDRDVKDLAYFVEIYTRHGIPEVMGSSASSIDTLSSLDEQILKIYENSLLVGNRAWNLAEPTDNLGMKYPQIEMSDQVICDDIGKAHHTLLTTVSDTAKANNGVKINSGELFTNRESKYFETSTGLTGSKDKTDIYFEMALEKLPLPNTQEVLKYKKAISLEEADLASFMHEVIDETLSIEETQLPATQNDAVIMVAGEVVSDFFHELVGLLFADREYAKQPFLENAQAVFKGEKQPLSDTVQLTLDPTLAVMAKSSPYTSEGLIANKAKVIEDDIVKHQIVHHKMGQYLNKPANNIDGNIVLGLGVSSKKSLLDSVDECIEILSFSSLLIDSNTLTWSSEIKLGKLYRKGEYISMVKGGVVSGDFRENLCDFSFDDEEIKLNSIGSVFDPTQGYIGPNAMLIRAGVKIAGE
jgi:predicted Zn-dependent protease